MNTMYSIFKRVLDVIFSILFLIILSPLLLFIYIFLLSCSSESPFFTQARLGKDNKSFNIIKFRTMDTIFDLNDNLLPDNERLTSFGSFLRKYSLDELPQLFNILIGDMSFIGPRPFLFEYLYLYSDFEKKRHNVLPGLTGWAQVNGRNSITWKDKFILDVYYVEHISFYFDMKILFLTLFSIFNSNNINQGDNITMEKYNGKN